MRNTQIASIGKQKERVGLSTLVSVPSNITESLIKSRNRKAGKKNQVLKKLN